MKYSVIFIISILLFSIFSSLIIHPVRSENGLVGWWKFDEGSGTTAMDSSGNDNTGTLTNGPVWVDGQRGKALSFDGLDDYVRIEASDSLDVTSQVTVEAWVYPKAYVDHDGSNSHIASRTNTMGGHIYVLSVYPDSHKASYSVNPNPDQHPSSDDLFLSTWTHLAVTYDGSYVRLYINGIFDSSYAQSGSIETTTNWLAIGCNSYGATYAHFNGTIDEVRIYNRALSQKEIQEDIGFTRGPRMDNLCIMYYENSDAVYDALRNGEVDLTDAPLTQPTQMEEVFDDPNIQAAASPACSIFQFDLNNNATTPTYRDYINPTASKKFRQGIACLVDKDYLINNVCNYSYRIDTPIPRPNGDWWVNWNVSQYDAQGNLIGNYPYEYDPWSAAYYFDLGGFVEGENTPNPYYNESFPASAQYLRMNPETDEDLDPLIFYIRNDSESSSRSSAGRLQAGRILVDNLRRMGIPVDAIEANYSVCVYKVMIERDYHIYTGGWGFGNEFSDLSLYASEYINEPMMNYVQFRNATYDELVDILLSTSDIAVAGEVASQCQRILIEEAVCVWLYSTSRIMGYRNIQGVVNSKGGSIDNQWTFLTARTRINATRSEIYYGLRYQPQSLNTITGYWTGAPAGDCLDRIYDTLLSYCPYDTSPGFSLSRYGGKIMPWMAADWEVGFWESPYDPEMSLTKLTFHLRDGILWHDGAWLTSADVKFTIEYLKEFGSQASFYGSVVDVHHVETPNLLTVVVYENISSPWALDTIGRLPILPKHIFESIENVEGYTPGADEGLPANETLIGSGPWKYVYHNSSMLYLEANRDYFMQTPPEAEIDFRYDWELGCWVVDAMDATMIGEACGYLGNGAIDPKWEPGCDLNGDCIANETDLFILQQQTGAICGVSAKRYILPPPTDTAIYLEPSEDTVCIGENITVYVKLNNLDKLSGIQFKLNYDKTKLQWREIVVDNIFWPTADVYHVKQVINQTEGFVWVCITSLRLTQPLNGNKTLATIIFNAQKPGGSLLDLWSTKLSRLGALGMTCQLMPHNTLDHAVVVGVSTPVGTNVSVTPVENANVTFAETYSEGVTSLNIAQSPSPEFVSVLCYDIKTTATYTGNIKLEFAYDPTGLSLEDEQSMKIWLWDETSISWIDITSYVDTDENVIYGIAPHLSMFGVTCDLSLSDESGKIGEITAVTPTSPPSGLEALKLVVLKYYELQTTASYEPPIILRIAYGNAIVPPELESFVQIWLWEGPSQGWIDITWYVDTISNVVYGVAPHLSMFGVTSFSPPPEGIVVSNVSCSKTVVGQGYNITVNFTVENRGDFTKTFDVLVHCNSTVLTTFSLILSPAAKITLSFNWSTAGWAMGNYAVSISSHLTSWIAVTIFGDVDGSFEVDIYDITAICVCYNSEIGQPLYYANCDVDGNGIIDIYDVTTACITYGQKYP